MHMKNNYYIYIYIYIYMYINISISGEKICEKYKCSSTYEIHTKVIGLLQFGKGNE